MQRDSHQIVIAGSLTRDILCCGDERVETTGGVVWHAGLAMAALGVPPVVVTRTALADRVLLAPLASQGVTVEWEASERTTTLQLHYAVADPDRRRIEALALSRAVTATALERVLDQAPDQVEDQASLLYLGPVHAGDIEPACIDVIAARRNLMVALDVQGLVRERRDGQLVPGSAAAAEPWLGVCDVLKADEDEARALVGPDHGAVEVLPRVLSDRIRGHEVVVTGGRRGAWLWDAGESARVAGRALAGQSTGAGDLFFAAYLLRRRAGDPSPAAAEFAAAFAADWIDGRNRSAGDNIPARQSLWD